MTAGLQIAVMAVMYRVYLHFRGHEVHGLWLMLAVTLGSSQVANFGVDHALLIRISLPSSTAAASASVSKRAAHLVIRLTYGSLRENLPGQRSGEDAIGQE